MKFSNQDIQQITTHGLTPDTVMHQLETFARGFPYSDLVRPATLGDGIIELSSTDIERYTSIYESAAPTHRIVKFVPASGAATRMFRDLFEFLNTGIPNKTSDTVLQNLTRFAFYRDLRGVLPRDATDKQIIEKLITASGLNYGNLPKALLAFHQYDYTTRTAVAEHLAEGATYATSNNISRIHFTVSPEHMTVFSELLTRIVPEYEREFGVNYEITTSTQKPSTDTIAVNPDNTPFRTDDNKLLFRPAGHGALIENLNEIDADIIFIKNIDNICVEQLRGDTDTYKRALAGMLIDTQDKIFAHLRTIDAGTADANTVREFITRDLGISVPENATLADMHKILNRPIRICGMVKSDGDTGGGPFWARGTDGTISRQIVETAQIAPDKRDILKNSTHFNTVDLVCGTRDYLGNRFDLSKYIDPNAGFITEKSYGGRPLRAMERPGLWNGAMAHWISIFVQTPASTFTPVKTVTDWLQPAHIGK